MRTPEELRKRLRATWLKNRHNWLAGRGRWPLELPIGGKTLKEQQFVEQWETFSNWLKEWQALKKSAEYATFERGHVKTALRFKRSPFGEHDVPCTWCFDTPEAVATELNELPRWENAQRRFDRLAAWLQEEDQSDASIMKRVSQWRRVVSRRFDLLADVKDDDFELLIRVTEWIWRHPNSGLYPRQLPIEGIDSKWIEGQPDKQIKGWRRVLTAWIWVLRSGSTSHNFYTVTGLRAPPDRLRVRLLDRELRAQFGGLSDIEAPAHEFIDLKLTVRRVLIVENLVNGLACEELPGTLVFMRRGYAVDALGKLPWLADLPVFYWGDIDTDGLAILNRLRSYLPKVQSMMMDEETLHEFKPLWGVDTTHLVQSLPHLTVAELKLYQELCIDKHGVKVRLEQERIAWDWAWDRLTATITAS